jgi:hypothetical protein
VRDLTWKFAEDRRTLFDRELYQHHLLFLPPACKHALANFACVLDPLRLKASDHITLTIHVQLANNFLSRCVRCGERRETLTVRLQSRYALFTVWLKP